MLVFPEAQLLCTLVPNQIPETDFGVKQKRIALILGQVKGDTAG